MSGSRGLAAAWAAALAAACVAAPGAALAFEGLPGSTWGELRWDFPSRGSADAILQGWARQGVAWKRWSVGDARLVLQTYATVRYGWDAAGFDWADYVGPGAGVAVDLDIPRMPAATVGAEYIQQWSGRSWSATPYTALFLDWFQAWDIRSGRWPGSTWGSLRWEIPNAGRDDLVLQGWVRQGWELHRWRRGGLAFVLGPYAGVRFGADTLGLDWNGYVAPGAGLALDLGGVGGFQPTAVVEYAWERRFKSGEEIHRLELALRWYGWWDLARR